MVAAVTALLGAEDADPAEIRATARDGIRMLQEKREIVPATLTTSQA